MEKIKELFQKYREVIAYLFFGGCTTVINIVTYFVCCNLLGIANVPGNVIAWILSVLFAFITNKLFVFGSSSMQLGVLLKEAVSFFSCRIATGLMDVAIMYVAVDVMQWNSLLWKILSNVLVIILNYIASKIIIFKK